MDEVGVDAARYFFCMRSLDSQLDFDMTLATEKSNENPVYYIQYAHARICSIARQLAEAGIEAVALDELKLDTLQAPEELALVKKTWRISRTACPCSSRTRCTSCGNLYL